MKKLFMILAIMALAANASAQNYNEHTLRSILEFVPTAPGTDGHRFTVPVTSTPVGPSLVNDNTAHFFNVPPDNIDWLSGFFPDLAYQYTAFRSADATVRNVFLSAIDSNAQFTTEYSPELIIEHLSLENVNVDPGSIQLRFDGTDFSWTMSNSRYATAIATPLFKLGVPLALRSVAGTSALAFWNGEIGSPTKLVVDPGTTLVLERVGNISLPQDFTKQLYFSQEDANTADVNGGTLELAFSGVIFDTAPVASVVAGQVTAGLVVRNGGALVLNGTDGSDSSTRLELRGGMLVDGSTVSLGVRTMIEMESIGEDETLVFNNTSVDLAGDAAIHAPLTTFGGTNTITTAAPLTTPDGPGGFRSTVSFQDAASVVNLRGAGDFFAEGGSLGGGTLDLDMSLGGALVIDGLFFGPGTINVASESLLEINGFFDQRGAGVVDRINVINDGEIVVKDGGQLVGAGTIAEAGGVVYVDAGGKLDGATSSGLTMGTLALGIESELVVGIDPSAAQSSVVDAGQLILDSPVSSLAPVLTIELFNDTVLPMGQKFLLVDYTSISPGSGTNLQFAGLPDGHVFQLGLNNYQILYEDPTWSPDNPSVITLTVIDEPVSTFLSMMDAEGTADGNTVQWSVSDPASVDRFDVLREMNGEGGFYPLHDVVIRQERNVFRFVDQVIEPGASYRYQVHVVEDGASTVLFTTDSVVLPALSFALEQNHPNPFNPSTTIAFKLEEDSAVSLRIYSVSGRLVRDLVPRQQMTAGRTEIKWDGTDDWGTGVAAGVYFYVLDTGDLRATRRMALIK